MPWTLTENLEQFAASAGPFLRARPVANTLPLTITETLRVTGLRAFGVQPPLFGWWRPAGGHGEAPDSPVTAACLQTPPFPLVLSSGPGPAFGELAEMLAGAGRALPGVNGAEPEAAEFAAGWQRHAGAAAAIHQRHRLYRLGELLPPQPAPPGRARAATAADRGLVAGWLTEFHTEAGSLAERDSEGQDTAARMIDRGTLIIWEDGDAPVSMAAASRQVAGMARVGPVYTPPPRRRRGYAAGATAAVTQATLDAGAGEVLLFTDLANPVSNSIYQRLGYEVVEDHVLMSFG